jgi:hypothetical protein
MCSSTDKRAGVPVDKRKVSTTDACTHACAPQHLLTPAALFRPPEFRFHGVLPSSPHTREVAWVSCSEHQTHSDSQSSAACGPHDPMVHACMMKSRALAGMLSTFQSHRQLKKSLPPVKNDFGSKKIRAHAVLASLPAACGATDQPRRAPGEERLRTPPLALA